MLSNILLVMIKIIKVLFYVVVTLFNVFFYSENNAVLQNKLITQDSYSVNSKETTNVLTREVSLGSPIGNYLDHFNGRLTTYNADCLGCSGMGNLACKTKENKKHSLKKDGYYYTDSEYGKVRILAAATSKFKCGTIVNITKKGKTPFLAVVLDTGGSMRKAWANKKVWMDLAHLPEEVSDNENYSGTNIDFDILRYGW